MKLSSRKQLLKESDTELKKIRLRILLESDGEVDTEKIEKVAQKIADKKTEKIQSQIEKDLENLKRQSISMQRAFEKAHRETGISIEEWYKDVPWEDKIKYVIEINKHIEMGNGLWDRIYFNLSKFLGSFTNISTDWDGNLYNYITGEKIEKPVTISPTIASGIRSVIQGLSI